MKTHVFLIKLHRFVLLGILPFLAAAVAIPAQAEKDAPKTSDDAYFNEQAAVFLRTAGDILRRIPPQWPDAPERHLALLLIDGVLHDENAPQRAPVISFFHEQMARAVEALEQTPVSEGMMIWKLYNHAFIARTASVTIAFDVTRGLIPRAPDFAIEEALAERLVRQCDVLFISHLHADHIDENVAQAFLNQGKPVIAPPNLWEKRPFYEKITHLDRDFEETQTVSVKEGEAVLRVVVFPGHQRELPNNVSLVSTPEGFSVCHTGDQSNEKDFRWIDTIAEHHKVDVLLPNNWAMDFARLVRGAQPGLIITGHENELTHGVNGRRANWFSYAQLESISVPHVVMTWGERFQFIPQAK